MEKVCTATLGESAFVSQYASDGGVDRGDRGDEAAMETKTECGEASFMLRANRLIHTLDSAGKRRKRQGWSKEFIIIIIIIIVIFFFFFSFSSALESDRLGTRASKLHRHLLDRQTRTCTDKQ